MLRRVVEGQPARRLDSERPRRLKQIKALHWQTPARGSFDHQRLFGALANRITLGTNHLNSSVRTREYLTTAEIERLMAAARKSSRYGHRDATMILIGYRHGLRASELCDLEWSQVELATGRLHVRRAKNGSPSGP